MNSIIRVFPRKTKWTPTDDLVFFDEPPLYELPDLPVYISVTFTWDIAKGQRLYKAWSIRCSNVQIGGPAFDDPGGEFVPSRFIKKGVVFTSRGCPKKCPWCLASKREGKLREISIKNGYIVNDNNLLACSKEHIEKVFEMLKKQKEPADFRGGLDIDFMKPFHIELLKEIKLSNIWVACDTNKSIRNLNKAADLLSDFPENKKRCYVMIGFNGETILESEKRLEYVYQKGFLPFAQIYRGENDKLKHEEPEWRALQRKWSRPAAYRSKAPAERRQ